MSDTKIELVRGDDWDFLIELTDTDTGSLVNLNGYKFWFTMKSSIDAADVDAAVQVAVTVSTSVTSTLLSVPNATTALVTPGTYKADIQMKTAAGKIQTFDILTIVVTKDVTRTTV